MTTLVFANGELEEIDWVRPYLESATAVIAADGGAHHLWRVNHLPQAVIGDMDSLPQHVQAWLRMAGIPFVAHPEEKDETDLELALLYALRASDADILVFAAFGGRFDQTLANILLLAHPVMVGRRVELVTRYERAWLISEKTRFRGLLGDTVSLVPLGGDVRVKRTTGLKWALKDETLAFGPARGVSNIMTAEEVVIEIQSGILLCIHTHRDWNR